VDGTVRRWNPDTGRQIGPTIEIGGWVWAIKYSPQSDKIASGGLPCSDGRYIASAGLDKKIYIWSLEAVLKQAGDQVRAHIVISLAHSLISN